MKIHQDGAVATATPSRKAVSFRDTDNLRHSGRTPLRETNNNHTPMKSPYFKSPSSTKKTSMTSNSFRQGLKKGCTPSSTKTKQLLTTKLEKENFVEAPQHKTWQQEYQLNQKPMPKTPGSASALRRTLRSTIQPQEKQQPSMNSSQQQKSVSLKTTSNISSNNGPFQSVATAMSYSSSYATSSLVGRSRLLGKGGVAPGNSMKSSLGPATRVVPKTPNTLLRTELEDEDEFDESLLLSPPPGALWNALNLSSGGGGDKGHTISPTVTTGLIVVSPQAADQIHTWSSTKKRLSSMNSTPHAMNDRVSPTVPRALMQTPHTEPTTTTATHSIQISPTRNQKLGELETSKKYIGIVTTDEIPILLPTDTQSTNSNVEGANNSEADKLLQKSVKKSTKGGVAMDMTGFFSLKDSGPLKMSEKKWVKSEALSSSMPAALRSRLISSRPLSSKKMKNNEPEPSSTVSKVSISKTKPANTELKQSARGSTKISMASSLATKSATSNMVKKNNTVEKTVAKELVKSSKNQYSKGTLRAEKRTSADDCKKSVPKPWKRQITKQNVPVETIKTSSVTNQKEVKIDAVKPWKKKAAQRAHKSKGAEADKSKSIKKSLMHQEYSKAKDSTRSGGIAFDLGFNDVDSAKIPLKTSTNQKKKASNSSIKIKTVESSNSHSWADKQSGVFVGWLNYTLNPEELDINGDGCVASGLRALIIHRRLAEGRINALNLFKGDSMFQIRTIIAKEISRGKLSIRSDRDVTVDVHLRKKLTSLLLSYTTPWLRLALEVMSGECIDPVPISENGPKVRI